MYNPPSESENPLENAQSLRQYTAARIGLNTIATSVGIKETLAFRLDHAHARDVVYSVLVTENLLQQLQAFGQETIHVHSQAATREEYLQRPDKGRNLSLADRPLLTQHNHPADVVFILGDGLSAEAVNKHALPVLQLVLTGLKERNITISPIVIAEQARVALADEIGSLLGAKLSLIFIGERPGLSSPDSMGVYITYNPQPGTTDESRNCISNIRPEGLKYGDATDKILYFIRECLRLKVSGIQIKDLHGLLP